MRGLGFLVYWLYKLVLSTPPENLIPESLFPVTVLLYTRTNVSLASIVTANLYEDLNKIVKCAVEEGSEFFRVWGRFDLLQAWIRPCCSSSPNISVRAFTNQTHTLARR